MMSMIVSSLTSLGDGRWRMADIGYLFTLSIAILRLITVYYKYSTTNSSS
jgi:hypothetical protein